MKKFISYLLAALTIFSFNFYSNACNVNGMDFVTNLDILELERQTSTETMLSNGIKKKENVVYLKYNYGEDFSESNYKYKTVRVEITYCDINSHYDRVIAAAYMEFNFRYNTELNEAKCLSTTHGQMCNDSKCDLKVFARTKNLSYESGESFGSIDFIKKGIVSKQIDSSDIIFCCDSSGNIIHRIQQT